MIVYVRVSITVSPNYFSLSRPLNSSPHEPIVIKFRTQINNTDVIACAQFGDNLFTNN